MKGELKLNHPLARYTSWRVGGVAEQFYQPADLVDLQYFLSQLSEDEPLTWLGLGSNVLIRDGGIPGTTILTLNRVDGIDVTQDGCIRAGAGVPCAKLAKFCAKQGWVDGAFFAGIPGTVGGALAMNAGAFGGETWRHVARVDVMSRTGEIFSRQPSEFEVHYREVIKPKDEFFTAGYFRFSKTGDVKAAESEIKALLHRRGETQPVGSFNGGSVFRNPTGDYAARLIESAGLKGRSRGDAVVSEKHANFIINKGAARAADIEALILEVAEEVKRVHGVALQREVHILGV